MLVSELGATGEGAGDLRALCPAGGCLGQRAQLSAPLAGIGRENACARAAEGTPPRLPSEGGGDRRVPTSPRPEALPGLLGGKQQ